MILPLQTFATLLESMSAGLQGGATQLIDLSVGSVLRALLEACASVALWMQWLILQVLSATRAATSNGSDLDSWMADFSLARLPGAPSSGSVTFGRYTLGLPATIPVGTNIKTLDGTLTFSVVQDAANPAWNGSSGYALPATMTSVDVPVQAALPGSAGNILSGAIGLLATAIPGVDQVSNSQPFSGGVDAETDDNLRSRFQLYINSRSLATHGAVETAIQTLRQGLRYTILENLNLLGDPATGNFCVVVDDGSGTASDLLISQVSSAVDAVRPLGTTFSVTAPVQIPVSVQMTVVIASGASSSTLTAQISAALTAWITSLPMGGSLAISKLEAVAHMVSSSVSSITSTIVNGAVADVHAPAGGVLVPAGLSVTVA